MKITQTHAQVQLAVGFFAFIISDSVVKCADAKTAMKGRKLVLMSMDGFRHDYLSKIRTPNFDRLLKMGVSAPYVNNTFTTLTFPSHYTIVTGRYEESHGIVDNVMYDPDFNATFTMGNNETRWWNEAEPIWIKAVKAGLKVGTYFWVGSEVEIDGVRPTTWKKYDGKVPYEVRVDEMIEWLTTNDYNMALIYFDEPDHSGHIYGPESPKMIPVIQRMDSLLGYFLYRLEQSGLKDKTDFILTSDHGMTTLYPNQHIYISDYANSSLVKRVVSTAAISHIIPHEGKEQQLVEALSRANNISVYLKENIPDHFHYRNNRRIQRVVAIADEGFVILRNRESRYSLKGTHGYNNDMMDMKPILMATGPSMATNKKVNVVKSVDIYPLLCHLLHLNPAPNNGSFERVKGFLKSSNSGIVAYAQHSAVILQVTTSVALALFVLS